MSLSTLLSHAGPALAIFAAGLVLTGPFVRSRVVASAVGLVLVGLSLVVPVGETSVFGFARGLLSPHSASSYVLFLFGGLAFLSGRPVVPGRDELAFAGVCAALGAILYLSTLGYLPFEVYGRGYDWRTVILGLAATLVFALACRSTMLACVVLVGVALRFAGAVDSQNGWDYFLDPSAWLVSVALLVAHLWPAITGRALPAGKFRLSSRP